MQVQRKVQRTFLCTCIFYAAASVITKILVFAFAQEQRGRKSMKETGTLYRVLKELARAGKSPSGIPKWPESTADK